MLASYLYDQNDVLRLWKANPRGVGAGWKPVEAARSGVRVFRFPLRSMECASHWWQTGLESQRHGQP